MMRSTIHVVSAGDYWPLMVATDEARRQWFLPGLPGPLQRRRFRRPPARLVRDLLASGPQPRSVLVDAVGKDLWARSASISTWSGCRRRGPGSAGGLISTGWPKTGSHSLAIAIEAAIEWLIRRYLGGFGPALVTDIGTWAGMPMDRILPTLDRMDLRRFRGRGRQGVGRRQTDASAGCRRAAPVRFLPVWDAILLVHARRKAVIAEDAPPDHLQHQDSPVDAHVHGRRFSGRNVAIRRQTSPAQSIRADPEKVEAGTGGGSQSSCGVPRLRLEVRGSRFRTSQTD